MLSISENIKEAYNSDKHSFELIAYFPNLNVTLGNASIVADSLKFNEDISDNGSFKLGTANATGVSFDFTINSDIGDADIIGENIWLFHSLGESDTIYTATSLSPGPEVSNTGIGKKTWSFDATNYYKIVYTINAYEYDSNGNGTRIYRKTGTVSAGEIEEFDEYILLKEGYTYGLTNSLVIWLDEETSAPSIGGYSVNMYDAIPLGHFIVRSCPVVSNSKLRTLTAYDVLYSSALDEGISYGEGTSITVADILQEVESITGFDLVGTTKYKNLLWSKADTGNTTSYSLTFDNGCEITLVTKTTDLTITSAYDSSKEHIISWLNPYSSSGGGGYRYVYQRLRDYFGLDSLKAAFPATYSGSDFENFDEAIDGIFRPTPQISAGGVLQITRFSHMTGNGKVFVGGDYDFIGFGANDMNGRTPNGGGYTLSTFSVSSYNSGGAAAKSWTVPIMGRDITVELLYADVTFFQYPGTTVHYPDQNDACEIYVMDWIEQSYLLKLRDDLVDYGFAQIGNDDEDSWENIVFYNDSNTEQYSAYFNLCQEVKEIINQALVRNLNVSQTRFTNSGGTYVYEAFSSSEYMGTLPRTTRNNTGYKGAVEADYSDITFLNFPLLLSFVGLGKFETVGDDSTVSFDDNPDSETGDVYWTPMNEVTSIKEAYSDDPIADLAFTTDAEITFTPRDIFRAWAELQGMCFKVNRNGDGVLFAPVSGIEGLYPSNTLYPSESLYPRRGVGANAKFASTAVIELERMTLDTPIRYKGIRIETSDGWQDPVIYDADHANDDSYLIYDLSNEITLNFPIDNYITTIFDLIWETIGILRINSVNAETIGRPYLESGDPLLLTAGNTTVTTTLLKRTLKGINCIYDSFEQEN